MNNNEQRYIRWKTTPLEGGLFALQITEQSHRGMQCEFTATNGIRVYSANKPEFADERLFVRGAFSAFDFNALLLTTEQLAKVERALTEYNFAHSEFAEEWEIGEDGDGVYSHKYGVLPYEKDTEYQRVSLRVRRKKSDEDKARESFLASEYAEDWEIVRWGKPNRNESYFIDAPVEAVLANPAGYNDLLIIRRKQPPAPTGEKCVGCLCWVWDEDDTEKVLRLVSNYNEKSSVPYWDGRCRWFDAIPLTPDEVMGYLEKAKEAWGK